MRRNSGSNMKNIFIVIIAFLSIAIIIAAISAITNKKSSVAIENSNIEENQVLSDSETLKLFSKRMKGGACPPPFSSLDLLIPLTRAQAPRWLKSTSIA